MTSFTLPRALHTNTLSILGVDLVCHILDNGERVFDAASITAFCKALEFGPPLTEADVERLKAFSLEQLRLSSTARAPEGDNLSGGDGG